MALSRIEDLKLESPQLADPKEQPEEEASPAAAMSKVLRELQLDDWEIKAGEIELIMNPDGSQACLGHGAFGQVRCYRMWLSVSVQIFCLHHVGLGGNL